VMVSTLSVGEGFVGLGASVCLGNAGLGLGGFPVNADCGQTGVKAALKKARIVNRRTYAMSNIMSYIGSGLNVLPRGGESWLETW